MRIGAKIIVIGSASMLAIASGQSVAGQRYKILPDDGMENDYFGSSLAVHGTTAIIGALRHNEAGADSGAAYVFDLTTGEQVYELLPDIGAARELFGRSVAINGVIIAIGASSDDGAGDEVGAVYLFDAATGQQRMKIQPEELDYNDVFGGSIAISGTTLVVGAIGDDDMGEAFGAVYLFDKTTGEQLHKYFASDGVENDYFGSSVAIEGTTVVVGAVWKDDGAFNTGAAYVFDTRTGKQIYKLEAESSAIREFGHSIAVSGTTAIISAPLEDIDGNFYAAGAVYLFDLTTGQQTMVLQPDDVSVGKQFGTSVAIDGTTAVVGAILDRERGNSAGAAYLFDIVTGQQIKKLHPDDAVPFKEFGSCAALYGTTALIGVRRGDENGVRSGEAYVFGTVGCSASDINGDGIVDSADLGILIAEFGTGCP